MVVSVVVGRIAAFWPMGSELKGNELANDQGFWGDLGIALRVDDPPPQGTVPGL